VGVGEIDTCLRDDRVVECASPDRLDDGIEIVGASFLCLVVGSEVMQDGARAERGRQSGDGVADPASPTGAGDEHGAATQRIRIPPRPAAHVGVGAFSHDGVVSDDRGRGRTCTVLSVPSGRRNPISPAPGEVVEAASTEVMTPAGRS